MEDGNARIMKRLDALLGIALTRTVENKQGAVSENVRFLRNLRFSNEEIAGILGKTTHHIEVQASRLAREGKIKKQKRGMHGAKRDS